MAKHERSVNIVIGALCSASNYSESTTDVREDCILNYLSSL